MCSSLLTLPAVFAGAALASDWWIIGSQQHFCDQLAEGDSYYDWSSEGTDCHSFNNFDGVSSCVFDLVGKDVAISGEACALTYDSGRRNPGFINTVSFFDGMDSAGGGCLFFPETDCMGKSVHVTGLDEISNCYDFDSQMLSFMCL